MSSIQGADTSDFPSLLDMVQADEPMVYNTLIDQVNTRLFYYVCIQVT